MTIQMNELEAGQSGLVQELECSLGVRYRLLELGLVRGRPVKKHLTGDPSGYLICGAVIAVREQDAKHISVEV